MANNASNINSSTIPLIKGLLVAKKNSFSGVSYIITLFIKALYRAKA